MSEEVDTGGKCGTERRKYEVRSILAVAYTIGYFGIIFLAFFQPFPEKNAEILKTLLVLLGTVQVAIIGYYYGASRDASLATTAKPGD